MKVAILGYGRQGQSAAEYWQNLDSNAKITICDSNKSIEVPDKYASKLGEKYLNNLDEFDLIVRSPSIHPKQIVEANSEQILKKITSTTNEFFKVCPTKNIIGITGTKGKGTTSTLIAKMLEAAGFRVHLGGNIGLDPLLLLENNIKENDWVVLELANFQLIDIKYSPQIAVCLMVVPEHQDWHESLEEYYDSKTNLFRFQNVNDRAIYNGNYKSSEYIASFSPAKTKLRYDVPLIGNKPSFTEAAFVQNEEIKYGHELICNTTAVALIGRHNLENVAAAISAVWEVVKHDIKSLNKAIESFNGMEHRLEFVREHKGVSYYNDSFATTPEATIAAIKSFSQPKIIILGGSDKGISISPVVDEIINSNVKHVIVVGEMAKKFMDEFLAKDYKSFSEVQTNMNDIVSEASKYAKEGDVVLLSTACASFGMFEDYQDRGEQFKNIVKSIS